MDALKVSLFGKPPYTRKKLFGYSFFYIAIFLAAYGWNVNFVPSSEWNSISKTISTLFSIVATSYFWWLIYIGAYTPRIDSKFIKLVAAILMPFASFFMVWLASAHGAGSILTSALGTPYSNVFTVNKQFKQSLKSCKHRVTGENLNFAFPAYICTSYKQYQQLPNGLFKTQAIGNQSIFGSNIEYLDPTNKKPLN